MTVQYPPPPRPAPEWSTTQWFGSDPLDLRSLRGRVVVVEAFQMLCPACVSQGLPQATRLARTFGADLAVVGLHTAFEHHEAMTPTSLAAFLSEYRIPFPVGVDAHRDGNPTPVTFARYGMRGTPTTVLIDRDGNLRAHHFGAVEDMGLAAGVTRLLGEPTTGHARALLRGDDAEGGTCPVDGACSYAPGRTVRAAHRSRRWPRAGRGRAGRRRVERELIAEDDVARHGPERFPVRLPAPVGRELRGRAHSPRRPRSACRLYISAARSALTRASSDSMSQTISLRTVRYCLFCCGSRCPKEPWLCTSWSFMTRFPVVGGRALVCVWTEPRPDRQIPPGAAGHRSAGRQQLSRRRTR